MLDDIIAHDIAQGIGVPIPTTQNCLLPPWARIASRLRAHPTGLALLVPKQTFQEHTRTRRNTLLREQRTYPFLDFSKRRRPQRKRLFNRRCLRPRHSNHGCPWIQRSAKKATVMLGQIRANRTKRSAHPARSALSPPARSCRCCPKHTRLSIPKTRRFRHSSSWSSLDDAWSGLARLR